MIRTKKIRGQKRVLDRIERWKNKAKELDLEVVESGKRDYIKVWVYPFSNLDIGGSKIPRPQGKVRNAIINALFEIYSEWKKRLDTLGEPYYLKIWFYPENVAKSQVVCAIQNMLDWYEVTFHKPEESSNKQVDLTIFGNHFEKADQLNWEYAMDEILIDDEWLGDVDSWETPEDYYDVQRWLKRRLKHPHRKVTRGEHVDILLPNYTVWIGGS